MTISRLIPALAALTLGACALFGPTSPFAFDKKGDLVEFDYAWSAEASRQPALVRRLRGYLERAFRETSAAAEADRAQALAAKRPFKGHRYSRRWTTAGQSARLLSLAGRLSTSTGAAEPISRVDALLWDRRARAEIQPERLFLGASPAPGVTLIPSDDNRNRRFDHFRLSNPPTNSATGPGESVAIPITATLLATVKPAYRADFEVAQPQ